MSAAVIIPARLGSTRFPGKMLAADTGRPLVQHVVDQAAQCRTIRRVIVATDDQRIVDALSPFGTTSVMTRVDHASGTDRIAEAAGPLEDDIIVNVQGDEPEIEPQIIDALVARLESRPEESMATATTPFGADMNPADPNLVKVVMDTHDRAIYFSRCAIPFYRDAGTSGDAAHWLHLGIYAYRRPFLLTFAGWKPTPLEQAEKLEQLRALEHGASIGVLKIRRATHGIDTPAQYGEFVARWRSKHSST